jgi:hypothetical protein
MRFSATFDASIAGQPGTTWVGRLQQPLVIDGDEGLPKLFERPFAESLQKLLFRVPRVQVENRMELAAAWREAHQSRATVSWIGHELDIAGVFQMAEQVVE